MGSAAGWFTLFPHQQYIVDRLSNQIWAVQTVLIPMFEDEGPFDFPFSRDVNEQIRHCE
jgi:hypothetical protein